jgi:hypothetical protein
VSTETAFPQVRGTFAYATDCGCDTLSNPECVYVHTRSDSTLTRPGVPADPHRGTLGLWALNALVLILGLAAVMVWGGTEDEASAAVAYPEVPSSGVWTGGHLEVFVIDSVVAVMGAIVLLYPLMAIHYTGRRGGR